MPKHAKKSKSKPKSKGSMKNMMFGGSKGNYAANRERMEYKVGWANPQQFVGVPSQISIPKF